MFNIELNRNVLKTAFLLFITSLFITRSFAQDTVEQRNRLTDSIIERFYVLKADPQTRQGPYMAFFKKRTRVAAGNYKLGKRVGIWSFYETDGMLVERFDYTNNVFLYEGPLKSDTDIGFVFDRKVKRNDTLTRPVKIGGGYYGFVPYLNAFQVPFDTFETVIQSFQVEVELLISPLGRLADYKVHLYSDYYQYNHTYSLDVNLFSEADKTFLPATLNGKGILCRVFIKCIINGDGGLDYF